MSKDMVTSFRIDYYVWKKARLYAMANDMTMKDFIEHLINKELEEMTIARATKGEKR